MVVLRIFRIKQFLTILSYIKIFRLNKSKEIRNRKLDLEFLKYIQTSSRNFHNFESNRLTKYLFVIVGEVVVHTDHKTFSKCTACSNFV